MRGIIIPLFISFLLISCATIEGWDEEQVKRRYKNSITISDGISWWEMETIAIHYLYTTTDTSLKN